MPSLKSFKVRIASVKNTQKITKAMKMVAASKLRRARERAEAARPYSEHMGNLIRSLAANAQNNDQAPVLLRGTGRDHKHLIVAMTSDRGLCGAFNSSIVRAVKQKATALRAEGKEVKILCVGRKAFDQLSAWSPSAVAGKLTEIGKPHLTFDQAQAVTDTMLELFESEGFDVCTLVYNRFKSVISQIVTFEQLIPLEIPEANGNTPDTIYEYEPAEEEILADLLRRNLSVQVFHGLLESAASEQGARMSAMDSATRNSGDMIKKLTLKYNRTRQAVITKELIEIISGAEAL